jgi:4-carboxymuconolactone decarboxylase
MPRLPLTLETPLSQEAESIYAKATGAGSGLPDTYRALFANPQLASKMAELDGLVEANLESWVTLTVALTVAHERDCPVLWNSFEPLARSAGVANAVIEGISAGTAPRGLLPKDGIWVHFTLEVLRGQVRDSTWQAVTHLAGDAGAVSLALTACYYEMMARLNNAFGLDTA